MHEHRHDEHDGGDGFLILSGAEVEALLEGRRAEVIEAVRTAYLAHGAGDTSLPHSVFLRFPGDDANRIIALPAFLGDGAGVAGVKWISSFPGNVARGMARASAVLVLNSRRTGRPTALMEASLVSAQRTAASAALAALVLLEGRAPPAAGLIGTGVINLETARFLRAALPETRRFVLFDLDAARARALAEVLRREGADDGVSADVAASAEEVLRTAPLVSFATTALRPHVADLGACPPGAVVLHLSLRDLSPEAVLAADNVVDDADHVCRAGTSLHLAEQATGGRAFIRASLAEVLAGTAAPKRDPAAVTVFSPFGLGILDLAVGDLVLRRARAEGMGVSVPRFFPAAGV